MERMSNAVRARVRDYLAVGQPSSGWSVSGNEISCGDVICAKISPQKHLWSWCGGCTYTLWPRWGPWEGRDLFYISRWAPSHNYPLPRSSPPIPEISSRMATLQMLPNPQDARIVGEGTLDAVGGRIYINAVHNLAPAVDGEFSIALHD